MTQHVPTFHNILFIHPVVIILFHSFLGTKTYIFLEVTLLKKLFIFINWLLSRHVIIRNNTLRKIWPLSDYYHYLISIFFLSSRTLLQFIMEVAHFSKFSIVLSLLAKNELVLILYTVSIFTFRKFVFVKSSPLKSHFNHVVAPIINRWNLLFNFSEIWAMSRNIKQMVKCSWLNLFLCSLTKRRHWCLDVFLLSPWNFSILAIK